MAKTNALISCAVTAQLICVFVFAYANCWFSHAKAHMFIDLIIFVLNSELGNGIVERVRISQNSTPRPTRMAGP